MNKFLSFFNRINIKLFNLSSKFFFIDFRTSISILRHTIKSINSVKNYSNKGHKTFCFNHLKKDKKSDTLFILGSGHSINEIKKTKWKQIKSKESWGFNNWFIHDFVPNFFFVQSYFKKKKNLEYFLKMDKLMKQILFEKRNLYKNVNFYIRGDNVNNNTFHESQFGETILKSEFKYFFMSELIVRSKCKIRPYKLMISMYKLGFFKNNSNEIPIPKFGNTITELICLALIMGYKEIVLCGIDMNDSGHFYDKDIYLKKYVFLKKLNSFSNKNQIHPHADRRSLRYTTKDVIMDLNKFAKEKFDSQIFVSSETSSLYPEIKKYEFEE